MSDLSGSTVVVIGGSSGIGLETARLARAAGAKLILTGRNRERLDEHLLGALRVARESATRVRPGGSVTFMTGTDARHASVGSTIAAIMAALAVQLMTNTALTGATYDVDGGQQLVP